VLVGEQLELVRQQLVQELDEEQQLVQELELDERQLGLEEQLRRRNHGQPLQASKRHRASTGCRRRFSTVGCRGRSASCRN
jgi:hypothetical protein